MNTLGLRIQELRKANNWSQSDLSAKIDVSLPQVQRHETKDVQPPADVLNKIADVFNVSLDFLVNGDTNQKAMASLKNATILSKFREVEALPEKEQHVVLNVLNALIRDYKARLAYAS